MLPVFREKADTPAMIHHALKLIQKQTNHLNPGQTPVMTADQPLYAITKQIQWAKSETFGEEKFLVIGVSNEESADALLRDGSHGLLAGNVTPIPAGLFERVHASFELV